MPGWKKKKRHEKVNERQEREPQNLENQLEKAKHKIENLDKEIGLVIN